MGPAPGGTWGAESVLVMLQELSLSCVPALEGLWKLDPVLLRLCPCVFSLSVINQS